MSFILGLATVLGGIAAVWYFRDKLSGASKQPATASELQELEERLLQLLDRDQRVSPEPAAAAPADTATQRRDELRQHIARLQQDRERLLDKLVELGRLHGVVVDRSSVTEKTLADLHLPAPLDKAVSNALMFLTKLDRASEADIRYSGWVSETVQASVSFLDILIRNSKAGDPGRER